MSEPVVSIIIPCYNRENYISDAINSALNQTYSNIEIIIVDDGSIDNSVAVIEAFGDKVILLKQKNSGVSAARNAGLKRCNGKFILFLDSDDWLSTDIVEKHIETTIKWPSASVYSADSRSTDENGREKELTRSKLPNKPECPINQILLTPPPFPACELYRKSVVQEQKGYDETMPACEDSDLRIRIMLSGATFVRTDGGYGVYRPVENSITKNTLRLHKYAVKLIKKLSKHFSHSTPELESLLVERLLRHRMRWWCSILSFHTSLMPLSIGKFLWHLGRVLYVDLGYIIFIFRDKPWTIDKNRYL